MPRAIRFHLDEHVATAVAEGLRRLGVDVTTTPEAGLLGATDEIQIAYAVAQGRMLFTEDEDFLVLTATGVEHPGIAYCRRNTRSIGDVIRGLQLIWDVLDPDDVRNRVEYL